MQRIDWEPLQRRLEALAAKKMSAAEIAYFFRTTRNAVIGRCFRTGVKLLHRPGSNRTHPRFK